MQSSQSPFVVNIVPLANVQTTTTGEDTTTTLTNNVAQLQQMINYDTKSIYTDYLGAFTNGGTIEVLSPLNLSNVGITSNGTAFGTTQTSIGTASNTINFYDTATDTAVSFIVNSRQVFGISGRGNGLYYDVSGIATEFRVSSMVLRADATSFSTLNVDRTGSFGGAVFASGFNLTSDISQKTDISRYTTTDICGLLKNVNIYSYKYKGSQEDEVGLLAQEVEAQFPDCVQIGANGYKFIKYNTLVSILLGAIKELGARLERLENK
jgi:hypothetical protein